MGTATTDDTESSSEQPSPQLLWQFWVTQIAEGVMLGVIFITMTIAPKYITGAEVGLCILVQTVLGPFFVYLAYGDVPSVWTLVGGSLLLVVLAVHESRPLFEKARKVQRSLSRRLSSKRLSTSSSPVLTLPVNIPREEEEEEEDASSDRNRNQESSKEGQLEATRNEEEEENNIHVLVTNNSTASES